MNDEYPELEDAILEELIEIKDNNYRIYLTLSNKRIVLIQNDENQIWELFSNLSKDIQYLINKQNQNFTIN